MITLDPLTHIIEMDFGYGRVPAPGRFEAVLAAAKAPANDAAERERYELRGWFDGYRITDRGVVIATFHGPQLARANRLLRLLREEGSNPQDAA